MKNHEYSTRPFSPPLEGQGEAGAGEALYIHIPFCKQACHYCDFHFSTSMKNKGELVAALCKELVLRKKELRGEIGSIYFGGGTPSLLTEVELKKIFNTIFSNYKIAERPEITLEANPDDLSEEKLKLLAASPINRLSIGVQSFFEKDLKLMNRAHNATEARDSVEMAKSYFENVSIDLIYGIPGLTNSRWEKNLETALELDIPHISSYALTVEPRTALKKMIEKGKIPAVSEELAAAHYQILVGTLETDDYVNYEFSNFGKIGFFSRNNLAYWFGKPYLGIGPSAHSYVGNIRKWNVKNNALYVKSIGKDLIPSEMEQLSTTDAYNEYVMTRLRTQWGVSLSELEEKFGGSYREFLLKEAEKGLKEDFFEQNGDQIVISRKAKFLSDGLAADLFYVNL